MDLIADPYFWSNNDWVFLTILFAFFYLAYINYNFSTQLSLILKAPFSQKYANQFLRLESSSQNQVYLLPIFVFTISLFYNYTSQKFLDFLVCSGWISLFFFIKYLLLKWLGFVFQKNYVFEELIFHSFLYEKTLGMLFLPLILLLFYSPFSAPSMIFIMQVFLLTTFLYKLIRMAYLSFFNTSFSKAHIIIYLCTFEILPLVALVKFLY